MLQAPEIVKIGDTEYKVSGFTQKIQDNYERYMQYHLLTTIKENKGELADDYLPLLQKHFMDVKAGKLGFMGLAFWDFIQNDVHFAELLWYCFAACSDLVPNAQLKSGSPPNRLSLPSYSSGCWSQKKSLWSREVATAQMDE